MGPEKQPQHKFHVSSQITKIFKARNENIAGFSLPFQFRLGKMPCLPATLLSLFYQFG